MSYTAIAETGEALVMRLRDGLVPKVVRYGEQIDLCAPQEKGDYSVKVWLYDIKRNDLMQSHAMIDLGRERQNYPSAYVELCYMITAFSSGDVRDKAKEEALILGRIIQVLTDAPELVLPGSGGEIVSRIELKNLDMEDKIRICPLPDGIYKASLFYEIGPVEIASERQRQVKRVSRRDYRITEKEAE